MYKIYVDYDGVLVDFLGGVKLLTGLDWNAKVPDEEKRERNRRVFESGESFWINCPPMQDFQKLWGFLEPHEPLILTAVPKGFKNEPPSEDAMRYARVGKWIWNTKYTKVPEERFNAVMRFEKQLFATSAVDGVVISNILIDDHEPNVKEWIANRGIGILHKSAEDTIQRLKQLGVN
jgi:hypothetical protein